MMEFRLEQKRHVGAFPGPKSKELAARRQEFVSNSISSQLPVFASDSDGAIIRDVDGNQFLDFGSGIAVTSVGASHPAVVKAVQEAVAHATHLQINLTPYEGYVAVCQKLAELVPGDHAKKGALFNSGAEAVENAIKIARKATGRNAVVVFDHAFHGRTNLTMAMTAKSMPYKDGFGPFAPEVYRMPGSYPFRDGLTGEEAAARTISQIEKQIGADNVAAIILEPIQGEGGFIEPAEGFIPALVKFANEHGIVYISDEIQAGMRRTGPWFAIEHDGAVPDLVTIAKGVAGGMPLSAVIGRAEIMDAPHPGGIGGTYAGNPVATAAALATIGVYEDEKLGERALEIEKIVKQRLKPLVDKFDVVGEVRGRGAMLAIEFVVDKESKTPNPDIVKQIVGEALEQGALFLSTGTYGNVIRLLPPLVITDEVLEDGMDVLIAAIEKFA